jgi:hypothetical protein
MTTAIRRMLSFARPFAGRVAVRGCSITRQGSTHG